MFKLQYLFFDLEEFNGSCTYISLHTLETTFGDAFQSTHLSTVFLLVTPKSVGKSNGEHHNVIPSPRGPAKKKTLNYVCVHQLAHPTTG